jgi:hypothetical protein
MDTYNYEESEEVKHRRKFLDDYNNLLPQIKYYDEEFKEEISIPIGGICDSEYMEYVYNNIDIRGRIKHIYLTKCAIENGDNVTIRNNGNCIAVKTIKGKK